MATDLNRPRTTRDTFGAGMTPEPTPGFAEMDLPPDLPAPGRWLAAELMRARSNLPFVPLMPFPAWARTVILAANVAQDIVLPDDAAFIRFACQSGVDFYASLQGNAEVALAGTVDNPTIVERVTSILNPHNGAPIYYVRNQKTISVASPTLNCVVCVHAWPEL
jgi:hypothetical protein